MSAQDSMLSQQITEEEDSSEFLMKSGEPFTSRPSHFMMSLSHQVSDPQLSRRPQKQVEHPVFSHTRLVLNNSDNPKIIDQKRAAHIAQLKKQVKLHMYL